MSLPQAIFIDTCIFQAAQFQFESKLFQSLFAAAEKKKLKLLLPDPTAREMGRHMATSAQDAINALKAARKKHALLRKLPGFPVDEATDQRMLHDLQNGLLAGWSAFKGKFALVLLDYKGIDLREIMHWHDTQKAPFGSGDKRKEFPDAFAFVAIRDYAIKTKERVAVVSSDKDFKHACHDVAGLFYFSNLSELTTALLTEEKRFADAHRVAFEMRDALMARIKAEFPDRGFDHSQDPNGRGSVENVAVNAVAIGDDGIGLAGLGHQSFEIQFQAHVEFEANVEYDDPTSWISGDPGDDVFYLHTCRGRVTEQAEISGTAKIEVDENWKQGSVANLEIDQHTIEVEAEAPQVDDRDEADEPPAEPGASG